MKVEFDSAIYLTFIAFLLSLLSHSAIAAECHEAVREQFNIVAPSSPSTKSQIDGYKETLEEALEDNFGSSYSFCLNYEIARLYTSIGHHGAAVDAIKSMSFSDTDSNVRENPIYNLLGYSYLQLSRFEDAAESFEKQSALPGFQSLSEENKIKVYNNLGYTYIQLGLYDQALEIFQRAASLGSESARENIVKTRSLLASLVKQSKDSPGVFGAIVASSNRSSKIYDLRASTAKKLGLSVAQITVYRNENRYFIVYGSNLSYPAALENKRIAETAGVANVWIAPTSGWKDVTRNF